MQGRAPRLTPSTQFRRRRKQCQLRTRYYDRLDERWPMAAQVVILGAGLDTRAQRKRAPGVAYFEIDDAAP
jgi:O-methyltransferase involved in polyketide biosynthesis